MHQPIHKRPWIRRSALLLLVLLLSYGTYRAVRHQPEPEESSPTPNGVRIGAGQGLVAGTTSREVPGNARRDGEADAVAARHAFRRTATERSEEQLKRYANMSPAEKVRHLDEQIDRAEKMRQQFVAEKPERLSAHRPRPEEPAGDGSRRIDAAGGPQADAPP